MNEQLQQALTAILNKTMEDVDAGVSFLSSEVPDVIHQLLMWKIVEAVFFFSLTLVIAVTFCFWLKWAFSVFKMHAEGNNLYARSSGNEEEKRGRAMRDEAESKMVQAGGIVIGTAISTMGFLMIGIPMALKIMKIWIAPKIYLIEYAASLAK